MAYTVFLDRDGVINKDSKNYVKDVSEFTFIEKSAEAVAMLSKNGFDVIIITNQSVIGRRLTSSETLDKIFEKMKTGIASAGGTVKDIFFCPHRPSAGCTCRKPRPGLILQAKARYGIDLARSCMVGDSVKDMVCAANAGCGKSILVMTGNGRIALPLLAERNIVPDFKAENLYKAAGWIVENLG